jgi:CheY-like chemotaxis protein
MRPDLNASTIIGQIHPSPLFSLSNQVLTSVYRSHVFNLEHKNIHKDTYNVFNGRRSACSPAHDYLRPIQPLMPALDCTVLIIDDDPLHLKLYTWILQRNGYKCLTAQVKSTSVELPKGAALDVVLLDFRLSSSLSAIDVAKQVKLAFPSIPILVLSELQWMPEEMREYATDFVNKGDPQKLVERIAEVVQDAIHCSRNNGSQKKDSANIPASKQ